MVRIEVTFASHHGGGAQQEMFTQPWASYFLGHARNPRSCMSLYVYVNVEWPNGNFGNLF